jgi:hypothetical protein
MPPELQSYLGWCLLLNFFSLFDGLHNLVQRLVLVKYLDLTHVLVCARYYVYKMCIIIYDSMCEILCI